MTDLLIRIARDRSLSPIEMRILIVIYAYGSEGTTRKILAERSGYDKSAVSRAVRNLAKKNWIDLAKLRVPQLELPVPQPKVASPATLVASPATRSADLFEEFWQAYPKKVGKKPVLAKWKARGLDRLADVIIADVKRRVKMDRQWLEGYVPHPITYINQDRWEDEMQTRPKGNGGRPQTQAQWERWARDHDINARPGESWEAFLRRAQSSYEVGR